MKPKKLQQSRRQNTIEAYVAPCNCARAACDCTSGCTCACVQGIGSAYGLGQIRVENLGNTGNSSSVTSGNVMFSGAGV